MVSAPERHPERAELVARTLARMGTRLRVARLDGVGAVLQTWVEVGPRRGCRWEWLQTLDREEAAAWAATLGRPIVPG